MFGGSGVAVGSGAGEADGDGEGAGFAAPATPGSTATARQQAATKNASREMRFKFVLSFEKMVHAERPRPVKTTSEERQVSRVCLCPFDHLGKLGHDLKEIAHDE